MLNIINRFLDIIFPPRESELIVRHTTPSSLLSLYSPREHEGITYLLPFQNKTVRALVTENKYFNSPHAAQILGNVLQSHLSRQDYSYVLIAIPLHIKRERERGHNQVVSILSGTSYPNAHDCIARIKHTTSQTKLSKTERMKNIRGAFFVQPEKLSTYTDTHFILVDDVLTTGATLKAARAALAPHIPPTCKLTCLALAH